MTAAPAGPTTAEVLTALHRSHDRLAAALASLTDDQVSEPSYADEWSIAQVASHLGSGAEVFGLFLDAGLQQAPTPGVDRFQPIWDRWNAKPPPAQAREAIRADAAFLARLDALIDDQAEQWRLDLFGTEQTLAGLLRMRLAEHALHTWDIAVALDPTATVPDDATALLIDNLAPLVERVARPGPQPFIIDVQTSGPDRRLRLEVTAEGVRLTPTNQDQPAESPVLALPGEAFLRLVYGRLDPDHTPPTVRAAGIDLDVLRRTFPGL
jgi:uncharacterized protein (TIGR03083 family)